VNKHSYWDMSGAYGSLISRRFRTYSNKLARLDGPCPVLQIDRLGHEVEGVHGSSSAQIGHVAVRRDDDRLHRRPALHAAGEQDEPAAHDRHVDVEQHQVDIRLGRERRQRHASRR